jgi:beta-lactamase class A
MIINILRNKKYDMKKVGLAALIALLILGKSHAQISNLGIKINDIIATKKVEVGVAIVGNNGRDTVSINGDSHVPMQSVFKFPIALAVLSEVDKGKFSLKQKIRIEQKELLPDLYSPIREKYPQGVTLTLAEILEYTVSQSDNVGCDVLLRLIGGPQIVEDFFRKKGFQEIDIKINEEVMQRNWDLQFQNWTTPLTANAILATFYENKNKWLSKKSYRFIWKIMKGTTTGAMRLKGQLPLGTVVAHKTGYSGRNKAGIMAAVNDIGLVFLPNGQHFYISVFITNSKENIETNERIIADIAKLAWDYFTNKAK